MTWPQFEKPQIEVYWLSVVAKAQRVQHSSCESSQVWSFANFSLLPLGLDPICLIFNHTKSPLYSDRSAQGTAYRDLLLQHQWGLNLSWQLWLNNPCSAGVQSYSEAAKLCDVWKMGVGLTGLRGIQGASYSNKHNHDLSKYEFCTAGADLVFVAATKRRHGSCWLSRAQKEKGERALISPQDNVPGFSLKAAFIQWPDLINSLWSSLWNWDSGSCVVTNLYAEKSLVIYKH